MNPNLHFFLKTISEIVLKVCCRCLIAGLRVVSDQGRPIHLKLILTHFGTLNLTDTDTDSVK